MSASLVCSFVRAFWPSALAICALSVSAPAWTQPAAADTLFREGVVSAKAGQYTRAIEKFRASYDLDPARGTLLGLAMAEQSAGRLADALGHYAQLRELATKAQDRTRVEAAEQAMADVAPRVPRLTIAVKGSLPPSAQVRLNGRPLPPGALGTPLPVNPGSTELTATAPGYQPFRFTATLGERERTTVEMELGAAEPAPPRPTRITAGQVGGIVLGTVGLVLLGSGTYLWVSSGEKYDRLVAGCQNNLCPTSARGDFDAGRDQERLARATLIAGGIALAAGTTWLALAWPRYKTMLSPAPGASASGGRWEGSF